MDGKIYESAMNAFKIESESLAATAAAIDRDQFEKAVEALGKAERIAASGCGHSGIACQHFAHLMCCIERPARFISPAEAVHGGMGYMQKGDVILLVSRGGKTVCSAYSSSTFFIKGTPRYEENGRFRENRTCT